jgi:hypothetical protein
VDVDVARIIKECADGARAKEWFRRGICGRDQVEVGLKLVTAAVHLVDVMVGGCLLTDTNHGYNGGCLLQLRWFLAMLCHRHLRKKCFLT